MVAPAVCGLLLYNSYSRREPTTLYSESVAGIRRPRGVLLAQRLLRAIYVSFRIIELAEGSMDFVTGFFVCHVRS